jgi:hypothetical protein
MNSSLALLLFDRQSKLSQDILQFEKDLRKVGLKYFDESIKTLKHYKNKTNNIGVEDLNDIVNRFQKECNSTKIFEQTVVFKEQGEGVYNL